MTIPLCHVKDNFHEQIPPREIITVAYQCAGHPLHIPASVQLLSIINPYSNSGVLPQVPKLRNVNNIIYTCQY